jgi:arylsulfatase A-like enzyme
MYQAFYRLRRQERTFAQVIKSNGYRNALFGKWHLSGQRGVPGAPVLPTDTHSPDKFGFPEWWANTCNINPNNLLGDHTGVITETLADSSSAIADKTNEFIENAAQGSKPFFVNVCFSAPHDPLISLPESRAPFEGNGYGEDAENLYGLIVELDNAIGEVRQKLRDLGIEKDTVVWFLSDNGGTIKDPHSTGGLSGNKNSLYEGGIRVPCAVEWPGRIQPRVTSQLSFTSDMALTICDLAKASPTSLTYPQDGVSLCSFLLDNCEINDRGLAFWHREKGALISDRWKIITSKTYGEADWELYDLQTDEGETDNVAKHHPDIVSILSDKYWAWLATVRRSYNGLDYPEKRVIDDGLLFAPYFFNDPIYAAYVDDWKVRPEYVHIYNNSMNYPHTDPEHAYYAPYDF